MKKEEKYCGECCWFMFEDTDGYGYCDEVPNLMVNNCVRCSDKCRFGGFLSRKELRHHLAVLLLFNRILKNGGNPIYRLPKQQEIVDAIDVLVSYVKKRERR